jgi:hypothetical protein
MKSAHIGGLPEVWDCPEEQQALRLCVCVCVCVMIIIVTIMMIIVMVIKMKTIKMTVMILRIN